MPQTGVAAAVGDVAVVAVGDVFVGDFVVVLVCEVVFVEVLVCDVVFVEVRV